MEHVEIAKSATIRDDLEKRLTGRFYTPPVIAERLVEQALRLVPDSESICDPFCGDGRLVTAWLRRATAVGGVGRLRRVVLWDYDAEAVAVAKNRIAAALSMMGLSSVVKIDAQSGDTFVRHERSSFGTVVTNPPWELLKPDARDGLTDEGGYKAQLRAYASALASTFPGAMSAKGKAMTGYGVNLARAGAIASAMFAAARGAVAIVLPASIFADQASAPFRTEFFSRIAVSRVDWYPAEARLFDGVDQSFVTATGTAGTSTSQFELVRWDKTMEVIEQRDVQLGDASASLPVNVDGDHATLVEHLASKHAPLSSLEEDMRFGLWLGRELDETRLTESLADSGVPFVKGRNVFPFRVVRDDPCFVDPKKRVIPATVKELRFGWRDVSRPNQRRRMHVAVIPPGHVTGNSLGVGYFRYGPIDRVKVLLAIMNSLAFEIQVRTRLSTAHVSQGVLRKCVVPMRCFEDAKLKTTVLALVDECLDSGAESPTLEVAVARAYGISCGDFERILDAFPKLTSAERAAHLRSELWS